MAYSRAVERNQPRHELRLCTIQAALASATIDARSGNYEPARQAASNFFTDLRTEIDKGSESVFDQSQRENLTTLLTPRDEVVTLLSRGDPARGTAASKNAKRSAASTLSQRKSPKRKTSKTVAKAASKVMRNRKQARRRSRPRPAPCHKAAADEKRFVKQLVRRSSK